MKKFLMASILFSFALLSGGCKEMAPKSIEGKEGLFAVIETAHGDIVLELFYEKTPLTVTNFVGLAEGTLDAAKGKKFYDGLKFHRVISDFMIQGGDPLGTGTGGPGYRFADEIVEDLKFTEPGLLAMANAGPGTNGSQFFITHVPTEWLNGNHTIFGKVVDKASQDVVNKVKQGDKMKSINIFRQGEKANAFTATQKDFDERSAVLDEKVKKAYAEKMKAKIEEVKKAFPNFEEDSNGIFYKITKAGSGEKCGPGKNVAIEYKGYFIDGTVFDKSAGRGPLEFQTNSGRMIPGFDIAVKDMKLGEKRTVVLPPNLAYGERGIPGAIPGNTYLAFDIELTSIN